jgi:hypothetical protein
MSPFNFKDEIYIRRGECKTQQKDSNKPAYARKELKETNWPTLGGKCGGKPVYPRWELWGGNQP